MPGLSFAPTTGLIFEDQASVVASDPNRADIALFVGYVAKRPNVRLPSSVREWLTAQGWTRPDLGRTGLEDLRDVPVPIDNWAVFDQLFDWEARPISDPAGGGEATTLLGAAVRSFFAQGGRKCYVVSVGDPWPVLAERATERWIAGLIPGYPLAFDASPADPADWHGMAHVLGLPDVSFLCMPDLADAVGRQPDPPRPADRPPSPLEVFVDCSEGERADVTQDPARLIRAPRCDEAGYRAWARAISLAAGALSSFAREVQLVAAAPIPLRSPTSRRSALRREVQLVAAAPIPLEGQTAACDLLCFLAGRGDAPLNRRPFAGLDGIASAFVQLAYPWLQTAGSANLPEGLENPEGVLAGLLARNALQRGAFRSAASQHLADVSDVYPILSHTQMHRPVADASGAARSLIQRVSLFGPTPDGWRLLSDVTTSLQEGYRPAGINRLTSAIVRAARRLGEELTFKPSGERLWAQIREGLNNLLLGLLQAGALRGASPAEAFRVRCDRSTMTQSDIDSGRVIVEVQFDPAAPIERITVVLALGEGGQVSVVSDR